VERRISKRKMLRRKYKRYAAAIAGAAIMTGAAIPGIPAAKTLAAESPSVSPPSTIEQTTTVDKNEQKPITSDTTQLLRRIKKGWHEHVNSWPSPNDNQALYKDGQLYYRSDANPYNDQERYEYANYLNNPVEYAKTYAYKYGFDQDLDSFTLLFQSNNEATVQIIKHDTGQRFKINLERNYDGDWTFIALRGIGDANFPATYRSL